MCNVLNYYNFINEKFRHSEDIRNMYYSDISKRAFYFFVNSDPTSIRRYGFSKIGKYTKWFLREYRKNNIEQIVTDPTKMIITKSGSFKMDDIFERLMVFNTYWFKNKFPKDKDILKLNIDEFLSILNKKMISDFFKETQKAKYDIIYENDVVSILVPLNFKASYLLSKDTEWCTSTLNGYNAHNLGYNLIRVVPKIPGYKKIKITKEASIKKIYNISSPIYPEMSLTEYPFNYDGSSKEEVWLKKIKSERKKSNNSKYNRNLEYIEKTFTDLLNQEAKDSIKTHLKKHCIM